MYHLSVELEKFLSTPSVWRATHHWPVCEKDRQFLSTPSVWRATLSGRPLLCGATNFYPRPPCGGRRPSVRQTSPRRSYFYPRPPCGGRRSSAVRRNCSNIFLSTPSVWRATLAQGHGRRLVVISIHALRVEGDMNTLPTGTERKISIHALRVEGDALHSFLDIALNHFYPRPPCGGRLASMGRCGKLNEFLSTPSVWRATISRLPGFHRRNNFYPRPPCGGRPYFLAGTFPRLQYFYPRPPCGGRQILLAAGARRQHISIHALRVEGDSKSSQNIVCFCSTNTKIRRSDITKIHTLCFDQNYFVLFYIIFQLSFGAKVPALFCPLHVRTRYSSSTSSCDHCG